MVMVKGLIFLGVFGFGKGIQVVGLVEILGIFYIFIGDMLCQAIVDGMELGNQVKGYMDKGELVFDQLIFGLIEECLGYKDVKVGWILDGFFCNVN